MKILVTGGVGYLGSVLVPKLLVRGHEVKIFDNAYFGCEHIKFFPKANLIQEDIRTFVKNTALLDRILDWSDCVIHLAAISNDPSAELSAELTDHVNRGGTAQLAEAAKKHGVKFIFSSSCSVYGYQEGVLDENASLNPLTTYAQSKVDAEKALLSLQDSNWSPIILRNGTLFGYSTRMRFDLVINIFSMFSTLYNGIKVFGDGNQWRPFLHVADCARAFMHFAELKNHKHTIYNIARDNKSLNELTEVFKALNPNLKVTHTSMSDADHRSYRVSTRRMEEDDFHPSKSITTGAEEICEAIVVGAIPNPEASFYNNVKWMQELIVSGRINVPR